MGRRRRTASGIALDAALSNAVGPVRPDLRGYVTTYAQVAAQAGPARRPRRGQAHAWSSSTRCTTPATGCPGATRSRPRSSGAARRLCLTGTPFRTRPDERIPFVRYDADAEGGWRSAADFTYGYREALRDGVVRPVVFAAYTGTSRWRNSAGEVIAASLSEDGTKQHRGRRPGAPRWTPAASGCRT